MRDPRASGPDGSNIKYMWESDGTEVAGLQFWFSFDARQKPGNRIVYYTDGIFISNININIIIAIIIVIIIIIVLLLFVLLLLLLLLLSISSSCQYSVYDRKTL